MSRWLAFGVPFLALGCTPEASRFGIPCQTDVQCGDDLVCVLGSDGVDRCLPSATAGSTCAAPIAATLSPVGDDRAAGLVVDGRLDDRSPAAPKHMSCDSDGDSAFFVGLHLDVPMSVRLRATADVALSVAVFDDSCGEEEFYGCAKPARAGSEELLVPVLSGDVRVVVTGQPTVGVPLHVRVLVEQLHCPAGFVPDADDCLGFASFRDPAPRIDHMATRLPDGRVVVAGGREAADGPPIDNAAIYDPRRQNWSSLTMLRPRANAAAATIRGRAVFLGGAEEESIPEENIGVTGGFERLFFLTGALTDPSGVDQGGTLVAMEGRRPALYVGPGGVAIAVDEPAPEGRVACADSSECDASLGYACLQEVGASPGFCVCTEPSCDPAVVVAPHWRWSPDFSSFEEFLPGRIRHGGVSVDGAAGSLAVIVGGQESGSGAPALPMVYDPVADQLLDVGTELQERNDVRMLAVGDLAMIVGGVDQGEHPVATVELFDPYAGFLVRSATAMVRARTDFALASTPAGDVVAIGGVVDKDGNVTSTTEVIDPRDGAVRRGPELPYGLHGARAVTLLNGDVLVVGGLKENGEMVTDALVLERIAPTFIVPPLGTGTVTAPPGPQGDTCDDPIHLDGSGGSVAGSTAGAANDTNIATFNPGCTAFEESSGLDRVYVVSVPANATLAVDAASAVDLAVYFLGDCPPADPCLAGADDFDTGFGESVTWRNTATEASEVFVVIDAFDAQAPYAFSFDWSVTP